MTQNLSAIGYIVGGGLKENLRVRLTIPSQEVQEGAFVVIESGDWQFYGLVTDLQLGATDPRFADEQSEARLPADLARLLHGQTLFTNLDVLPALIQWRVGKSGMPFSTEVSINLADDPELLAMMSAAGFNTVFVGIETPSEASLTECNKNQNRDRDLVESVRSIQHAGLQVQGGFIVGFDSDSPAIFQQQIDFIQKSGIVSAMVGLLQAPLGTRLHARLQAENRLLSVISGDNVDGSTNIVPKMGFDTLLAGYKHVLSQIYSPKLYYDRMITFFKEYRAPNIQVSLGPEHLLAFWLSIYHLGIKGVERFHYWRLWFWVLLHKPRLFPSAITLAIYGYHFRRICELSAS